MRTMRSKPIGEILLEFTDLGENELNRILQEQKDNTSVKTGETLLKLGLISEEDFLKALSIQLNIPYQPKIKPEDVDPSIVSKVPFAFIKKHKIFPMGAWEDGIRVIVREPLELEPLDDLALFFNQSIVPVISSEKEINTAIDKFYSQEADTTAKVIQDLDEGELGDIEKGMEESDDLLDVDHDAPIIKLVNLILFHAVKDRASDVHIEPFEKELKVRYRVDGILYNILSPPKRYQSAIVSRIKVMAKLDIAEKRLPQDGRINIKMTNREVDIRVSVVPTSFGERIVMRLLDKSGMLLKMEDIGLSKETHDQIKKLICRSNGIILVTGPTGSGKTTTLYSVLSTINTVDKNIITVEDPVEYQLEGIGQIQVNPKIDLTFANGLRSILRQDPDVIMVGEIRDAETAEIAIHASLTGHLVFSTLHTNDSPGAITRLVDMGIEPFLISSSVIAVAAQRLVRVICDECKEAYKPNGKLLEEIGISYNDLDKGEGVLYRGKGCSKCIDTGYVGRTGIYELLIVDDGIRRLLMNNADASSIRIEAVKNGMSTLLMDGAKKALKGITSAEEIFRVTQE